MTTSNSGLGERLQRLLGERFIVSSNPDIPNLVLEPDLLIGGEGRLFALFIPKVRELASPDKLLLRLAMTRIALPKHTICILLVREGRTPQQRTELFRPNFHVVTNSNDTNLLMQVIEEASPRDGGIHSIPNDIYSETYRTAELNFQLSIEHLSEILPDDLTSVPSHFIPVSPSQEVERPQIAQQQSNFYMLDDEYGFSQAVVRSWHPFGYRRYPRNLRQSGSINWGSIETTRRTSLTAQVRELCESLIQMRFTLDNGVPYPNASYNTETVNILSTTIAPVGRFDPLKSIRAAALAGWVVSQARTGYEVNRIADSIQARLGSIH